MPTDAPIVVRILHVTDCPLLSEARAVVRGAIAALDADVVVEEIDGSFASPTVTVNGADVTGRAAEYERASCRLDAPTRAQVQAAIHNAMVRARRSG